MTSLVLDANLLVLLVVGNVDPREITRHKRLSAYRAEDYDLLISFVGKHERVVTFPNLLTEASNLLRQCPDPRKRDAFARALALLAHGAMESYWPSRDAVAHSNYLRLGLTDAVVLQALGSKDQLLTADLDLYLAALHAGRKAENFTYLRESSLDS